MDLDEEDTALLIIHPTPLRQAFNRTAPQDSYERERLDYVHPSGWPNPQPADPSSRSSSFAIGLEIKSEFLVGTG